MKRIAVFALGLLCCALLFGERKMPSDRTPGAASAWTAIGPYGAYVKALARNWKFPNEIYAAVGSEPAQVFKSTSGAENWTRTVIIQGGVTDIALDPKNADVVYAYSKDKILKSSDRGATFPETLTLPTGFRGFEGRMVIHPANAKILFLAGSLMTNVSAWTFCPAVAKSGDGGSTWTVTKFEPTSTYGHVFDMGIHPKNPDIIYICTGIEKPHLTRIAVYRSSNGGGSYKNITNNVVFNSESRNYVDALALHPTDPNIVYVAHTTGIARTENGGGSWRNQTSPGEFELGALALDPAHPSTLYGLGASDEAGARGCWKSVDGGKTWTNYDKGIYGWGARLLVRGNAIIAGTQAGIFRSLNAGVRWASSHAGIRASRPHAFAVAPSAPLTIYAGVDRYGLFRTTNGGASWNRCPDFYLSGSIQGLIVHSSNPKKLFFLARGCGDADVYRSADGAQTRKNILHKAVSGIFGDPNNPGRIAATGYVYNTDSDPKYIGLYVTSNSGGSWTLVKIANEKGHVINAAAFAPSNANIIYAGGHTGGYSQGVIYKTANGGASWTRLPWAQLYIESIAVDPKDPDIVYAGTFGEGTFRSADGGQTWAECAGASGAYSILVNKADPNEVIVGGEDGVFMSADRGLTWVDISEGLIDKYAYHLEFHAASRTLFVGTSSAGIWKRKI